MDVATRCYKWVDGSLDGVRYRAPYGANEGHAMQWALNS